jgi:tetratricopeptide (TPR) repeat protein
VTGQANRCRDDLFARSRRAPLSAVEQRAFDAHLAVCDLCRAAGAFAAVYDAIPDQASAADELLVARLAERVAGRAAAVRPRRHARAFAVAAGLALLAAAGGAAAWVSLRGSFGGSPPRSLETRVAARSESERPRAAIEVVPEPNDPKPAPPEKALIRHGGVAERARAPRTSSVAAAPTAAELFADANAARRALDLRRATDLYLALDRRFPESAEAPVALVSAGDLLSRLGEPAAALRAFDRYLDRRPDGALAPEALFGRARTLRQLARRQDEIDAWRRLLQAFPGSVYESAGRQRLGELLR